MRVYKDTTFELSMMPWEVEPPRTALMVVVKGTFAFGDNGPCTIAEEQIPCLGEVPWDDGDPPSLKTETDHAVRKPRGEWYLVGTAHAPAGRPATVVPVRVKVGKLQKLLSVWGDRTWERGVLGSKPSSPKPFASIPLRWERSFGGGRIADNPVGRGTGPIPEGETTIDPLPNIEDPARPIVSRADRPPPAGMFPIPSTWQARIRRTGTYDARWKSERWPYFPHDFDYLFFNCAPHDQWCEGHWRGDEELELAGLHPHKPRLRTRLPGLRARLFVERATRRPPDATPLELLSSVELEALGAPILADVPLRLDTIVLDADGERAICQWRGLVDIADAQLSDIARIFVVHEPIDAVRPHADYERWLLSKLLEEAAEFEEPAPMDTLAATPNEDAPPSAQAPDVLSEIELAKQQIQTGMLGFLTATAEIAEDPPAPEPAVVRERLEAAGIDGGIIPDPELPPPPEEEESRSLRRLVAIVRRKLGKPFRDLELASAPYARLDLSGVDFSRSVLTEACFDGAILSGAIFDGATLARATFARADALGSSFREADLTEMRAPEANFEQAVFDDAAGSDAVFASARLCGASLLGAELESGDFTRCDLRGARLDGADLTGSILDGADLSGSSLVDTSLESVHAHDANFERSRLPDVRASDGADFTRARFVLVDAAGAQFQGAILFDANLAGSNFEGADFSEARAARVNLLRCVLRGACLDRADLTEAVLIEANLFEASLNQTLLVRADARGAHMHTADLWRANTHGALFDAAVLERTLLER